MIAAENMLAPGTAPSALLEAVGLSKSFGDQRALNDVGFALRRGEVLGVIGPNGAGKTTLLEAVAGLLPVDSGTVLWNGAPVAGADRRNVAFLVPDGIRPYGDQFAVDVIGFFAGVFRRSPDDVREVVSLMGLGPALEKRVKALSKGFNRRLMLAIGLLAPQPVLLMDEPFDGFDLKQTREMMQVLRRAAAGGRTLVLSIHQLGDAERVCDRFVLLSNGRVRGAGTLDDLRAQTAKFSANLEAANLEDVFLALT
jgi:ABC-2 type transport system ATP-binding protein